MTKEFKKEVQTIELIIQGSQWATLPEVRTVLDEYKRLVDAGEIKSREKKVGLQILFSSRAIDSFLKVVVCHECQKTRVAPPSPITIGSSLHFLIVTGVNGHKLDNKTHGDLDKNVLNKRNLYLHQAGQFPSATDLNRFIASTINGMRVISRL